MLRSFNGLSGVAFYFVEQERDAALPYALLPRYA